MLSKQNTSQPVQTYFDAIDARLSETADDGDKAIYLQNNLARVERLQRELADRPESSTASAFDLSEMADGLETRLIWLRTKIRSQIERAEVQIAPMFTVIQGGRA